jgi:hypothetical protein
LFQHEEVTKDFTFILQHTLQACEQIGHVTVFP